jgi:hypothetical protein
MASDLSTLLDSGSIAAQVQLYTGDGEAAASAGGTAAWIAAITGEAPGLVQVDDKHMRLSISDKQKLAIQAWLNAQVGSMLQPTAAPTVDLGLGPVLGPWSLQYAGPAIIGALVLGWFAHWLLAR